MIGQWFSIVKGQVTKRGRGKKTDRLFGSHPTQGQEWGWPARKGGKDVGRKSLQMVRQPALKVKRQGKTSNRSNSNIKERLEADFVKLPTKMERRDNQNQKRGPKRNTRQANRKNTKNKKTNTSKKQNQPSTKKTPTEPARKKHFQTFMDSFSFENLRKFPKGSKGSICCTREKIRLQEGGH